MLKDKLDGSETKAEIIEYLEHCDCPALKKKFITWTTGQPRQPPYPQKLPLLVSKNFTNRHS